MAVRSAGIFICERILRELDGVPSAIRIVEKYFVPPEAMEANPPAAMPVNCFGVLRADADDTNEYSLSIALTRPNGETKVVSAVQTLVFAAPAEESGLLRSATVILAVGIELKEYGPHTLSVLLNEAEVCMTQFVIARPQQPPTPISGLITK